ncbi:MAG: phenylacetate-CoA oxygenase subunit PaaC [Lewinella sp.]|nr:phenylacetate-CoA oxygenase subunit PaaC [Lewinella sp.]
MTSAQQLSFLYRLGDNALILGQRLGEWCGHGPILEQDIAMTNIALDLVGQARSWMAHIAEVEGQGRNEDQIAFLRDVHQYHNLLLVEQPNTDFAYTIVRQFLFDSFNFFLYEELCHSKDETIAAIAAKSLKEITYHLRYSSEWMIRLGDGTEVSHDKMQQALEDLWMYADEALTQDELDEAAATAGLAPALVAIAPKVRAKRADILRQATLIPPADTYMQQGGKQGQHTEHLGYILTEMQWMQRAYPDMHW